MHARVAGLGSSASVRRALLLSTALGAVVAMSSGPARAADECGAAPSGGGTVTCSPSGNPYADGVEYAPVDDLTVVLEPGVRVEGGVDLTSSGADLVLEAGDDVQVSTGGDNVAGVRVRSEGGLVELTVDQVSTTGVAAAGLDVDAVDDVTIVSQSVATDGESGVGVSVTAGGDLTVTSGAVATTGAQAGGVVAFGFGDTVTVDSGAVTTEGDYAVGIYVQGDGRSDEDVRAAAAAPLVGAGVSIASQSVETQGAYAHGISAFAREGQVLVDSGRVTTHGDEAFGIVAGDSAFFGKYSDIDIVVTSELVETTGEGATGILAASPLGTVTVDSGEVRTAGAGAKGIWAYSGSTKYAGGDVTVTSELVTTLGDDAIGIETASTGGNISIASVKVSTAGADSIGIFADATSLSGKYSGDVLVVSDEVSTEGARAIGIEAEAQGGDVEVRSGSVTTVGEDALGILAYSGTSKYDGGSIRVTSVEIETDGDNAIGIKAYTDGADVFVDSGSVVTSGDGAVGVLAYGPGTVTVISGAVQTSGLGAHGVDASQTVIDGGGGNDQLTVTLQQLEGPGVLVDSGSVSTSGDDSMGVRAITDAGDVEVVSDEVTTTGSGSSGIVARASGSVVVDSGAVTVSGAGSHGIVVEAAGASSVSLRGLVRSNQGFALMADGGPATITIASTGGVRGRIRLTSGDDEVSNGGTFEAVGDSDFGGGEDSFANTGVLRSVAGSATLGGLESFANSGRIDLRDGAPGDVLTISGAYQASAGARLGVDVDFGEGEADVLRLGAATGTTILDVASTGAPTGLNPDGILVVDAAAGTAATAFTLVGGEVTGDYLTFELEFDPAANDFLLVTGPDAGVFETSKIGAQVYDLWHRSAETWSAQAEATRDLGSAEAEPGVRVWAQAVYDDREFDQNFSFGSGGSAASFQLDYKQEVKGAQAGAEVARSYASGQVLLGVTTGYLESEGRFEATRNEVDLDGYNLGAYAAYVQGAAFVNALVKADWYDGEVAPAAGLQASFDTQSVGALGEAGYRFTSGRLFLEPTVSLAYVRTSIDGYRSGDAQIDIDDVDSLRGKAGLRIGGTFDHMGGVFAPFVGVHAVEEFEGEADVRFGLGQTLRFTGDAPGSHGVASAGFAFASGAIEASLKAQALFGDETQGGAVRAGLRLRW